MTFSSSARDGLYARPLRAPSYRSDSSLERPGAGCDRSGKLGHLRKDIGHVGVDRPFLEWFSRRFRALDWLFREFQDDMASLADAGFTLGGRLIVINGAEVPVQRPNEPDRHLRHMEMNTALDEVASRVANLTVCDVRPIVTCPEDVGNNLRHYQRRCYIQMAEEIRRISGSTVEVKRKPLDPIFTWLHKNVGPYHARIRRLRSR